MPVKKKVAKRIVKKVVKKAVKKAVKKPNNKKVIRPSTIQICDEWDIHNVGMTQSLWDTYNCKRAFILKTNGYGQPLHESKTHFGSIVHYINDKVYSSGNIPTSQCVGKLVDEYTEIVRKRGTVLTDTFLETEATKAHATMVAYFEYYSDDFKCMNFTGVEHVFETKFDGCKQRGRLDGNFLKQKEKQKRKFIIDHKTKGQINEENIALHLNLNFQMLFYILADELETGICADGALFNVIRNSQSKVHKNEKLKMYYSRILELCRKTPEHFFKRWEVEYTAKQHEAFRQELSILQHDIQYIKGSCANIPNRFACYKQFACEFLPACAEDSMRLLTKSTEPIQDYLFPELKED